MRKLAFVAFFLSGASSLIFQSIWSRLLGHVFGATSVAISTVVTCFMAGLGLGAWVAGRYAQRVRHPLVTYAVVELLVGLYAIFVPFLVSPEGWLAEVNQYLRIELGAGSFGFTMARFFCVLPVLVVPTTLMGMSLPLLARHFVEREQGSGGVGSSVGALYAINTLGAVSGVILGGFVLMPAVGVTATSWVAVSMNVALGVGIFLLRRPLLQGTWSPGEPLVVFPWQRGAVAPDAGDAPAPPDDAVRADDDIAFPVPPLARRAAFVVFAISGGTALCSEVTWSRALAMTIGSSFQSFNLILATFLVGIALGSAFAAAAIGRGRRPLRMAALAAVALDALANGIWAVEREWDVILASGDEVYLRLPTLWILLTVVFAAPIAVLWVAIRRREPELSEGERAAGPIAIMLAVPLSAAILNAVIFDGPLSMVLSAMTGVLCVFVGIVLLPRRYPVLQIALVQLFIAMATFVNYLYQDDIPCAFAELYGRVPGLADHVPLVMFLMFVTAGMCTLPSTLGMGAMFPMTLRLWTAGGGTVARDVGNVYAANTVGSVVGAWVPGFLLMPTIGMEKTLLVGIFLNLALGLAVLVVSAGVGGDGQGAPASEEREGAREVQAMPIWHALVIYFLAPAVPVLAGALYLLAWSTPRLQWNQSAMTLGVFRMSLGAEVCASGAFSDADIVYYRDGLTTTVSVEKWGSHYALKNNGKVDASNGEDMPTQIMVAGYPLMMHSRGAEGLDVAVIGFGSGVSVGAALQFPVASVDVIELERSIPDASKVFADVNHLDYNLPEFPYVRMDRLTVINDDGRNYLASSDRTYDVIVSEPSNPWITGVSDLFTTDHFRITKRRLREGGIYCQWVQLYELSPANIKSIYRTFASEFAHVLVFAAADMSSDTVLLGSDAPLALDLDRLGRALANPRVAEEMERAEIRSPHDVLARTLFGSRDEVLQFTQIEEYLRAGTWEPYPDSINDPERACREDCRRVPVVLNTDDNMHIELAAPHDLIGFEAYDGYLGNFYAPDWPYGRLGDNVRGLGEGDAGAAERARLALALMAHGRRTEAARFIESSRESGGSALTVVALEVLMRLLTTDHEPALLVEPPAPGPALASREARQLEEGFTRVRQAVDEGLFEVALAAMEEIPAPVRRSSGSALRMLYGYLLYKTADAFPARYARAAEELEELLTDDPEYARRHPELYYFLGRAHDQDLELAVGTRYMRMFVEARLAEAAAAQPQPTPTVAAPRAGAPPEAPGSPP